MDFLAVYKSHKIIWICVHIRYTMLEKTKLTKARRINQITVHLIVGFKAVLKLPQSVKAQVYPFMWAILKIAVF